MPEPNTAVAEAQPSSAAQGSSEAISEDSFAISAWGASPAEQAEAAKPKDTSEAQPGAADEGSSAEVVEGKEAPKKKESPLDPDIESKIESRVQKALEAEREKARKQAEEDQAARDKEAEKAAREKSAADQRELLELARKAKKGDLEAGERLIQKQIELFGQALDAEDDGATKPVDPEKLVQEAEVKVTNAVWQKHCESLGVDPKDPDFGAVPAEEGLKGLNKVAIAKSTDADLVARMIENPKVKAHYEALYRPALEATEEAGRNDGIAAMAGNAPKAARPGAGSGGVKTQTQIELDYMNNPEDPAAKQAWKELHKRLGDID